jgi:hypothetical protein
MTRRDFIEEVNSIVVTKEELRLAAVESGNLTAQGMGEDKLIGRLLAPRVEQEPDKAVAIYSRLYALSKVVGKQAWTLKAQNGAVPTHRALIDAAAVFPLSKIDGDVAFDPEGLLAKALELADIDGIF